MADKDDAPEAHEDSYRNEIPLDELPEQGAPRPEDKSAADMTAGRRDEQPRHAQGEVRLHELQAEVEDKMTEPPKARKLQDKLDQALSDTFPGSDPVALLEPKGK